MTRLLLSLIASVFFFQAIDATPTSISEIYLGSREGDPASLVENISTIHGDYTEVEVDLRVPSPDPLVLSRFYSSRDTLVTATLGGWRFYPQCFLTMQKDSQGKTYSTPQGKFERTVVYVGNPEGSILTYVGWKNAGSSKRVLFKIDTEGESVGLANTAKGNISSQTNQKNNKLYFNPQNNSFTVDLCSRGQRIYVQHASADRYLLSYEVLPSGNKIFYEFDEKDRLTFIKETNATEKKILGWIKIHYGNDIHVETSHGKTVDYHFEQNGGSFLLTEVLRSDKPRLHYQYQVVDQHALLVKKELPEGRFIGLDYYSDKANQYKVKSVTTPAGKDGTTSIHFVYGHDHTEVLGPKTRKGVYRFDDQLQLTAIEQYLEGSLYRVDKKFWGKKTHAGDLTATSVEDGHGNIFYYKSLIYDECDEGNIVEEREYGNLTGGDRKPLILDEEGIPTSNQEPHAKNYTYVYGNQEDLVIQKDSKGNGIELAYKKGTNLLIRKCCLEKSSRKKRWFYDYNAEGVLVRVQVDDGYAVDPKSTSYVHERLITTITPKQELPYVGAPEIVEEKYLDLEEETEVLLKRIVNQFDEHGNIVLQEVYDANGEHRYSIKKGYQNGLLISESDPMGDATYYHYDANQNLISEQHLGSGTTLEYRYDLKNRLISTIHHGKLGEKFETAISYDAAGNKIRETDRLGNPTVYAYDDLGRVILATYPQVKDGEGSFKHPTYSFTYDIFNHETSVTNPKGEVTTKIFTVHGKPTEVRYPDGTRELFKYDPEGSLHRHCDREGRVNIFEYDYLGRVLHIERYGRSTDSSGGYLGDLYYTYDALHQLTEKDEEGLITTYTYDPAGRLASMVIETHQWDNRDKPESRTIDFAYDPLGRTHSVKHWTSNTDYTLQVKEYDLLDRITEERTENQKGETLLKNMYAYDQNGQLGEIIGYPHNHKSILTQYEYDGMGRISKVFDPFGHTTQILYDDHYINALGQQVLKCIHIDALGNRKEEIFDSEGHVVKTAHKDSGDKTLAETECLYDLHGNKIGEYHTVLSNGQRLRTYSMTKTYGQGDRLTSITRAASSENERSTTFSYNRWGDVIRIMQPGAQSTITYDYTVDGKVASISYKNPGSTKATTYQIDYDDLGRVKRIEQDCEELLTSYFNNQGQLYFESISDEWGSYTVRSFHDGNGHIQSIQLPDASFIDYTYDGSLVKSVIRRSKQGKDLYHYTVDHRDWMGHPTDEILIHHGGAQRQQWDILGKRTAILNDFFQDQAAEQGFDALHFLRKRRTTYEEESFDRSYEYDGLLALIAEKGDIEHQYAYDSIGNRIKKDSSHYTINDLNEVVTAEGCSYTFDSTGNLATKTVEGKTWLYKSNPLHQLISVIDPYENVINFTYDPSGRRLTKQVLKKNKKPRIYRYFYLGETELGCLDEQDNIIELKVPSNPNQPEESPAISFEIKKTSYIPIYDLQGNVTCLIDGEHRTVVESYRYSVFGEEQIFNARGHIAFDSVIGNSWRYQGKRTEKEIGLVYFGKRYYDPSIGRWISPDPLGEIDGPNLYAYVRNNPLAYVDYFGLAAEAKDTFQKYFYEDYEPHCFCERHRQCKRGGDVGTALGGVAHGVIDFVIGSLYDFHRAAAYIGAEEWELNTQERMLIMEAIERSQAKTTTFVGNRVMGMLGVDSSNVLYQSFRSGTTMGLEIGSLVAGGYGVIKGVVGFSQWARMPMRAYQTSKGLYRSESIYQGNLLKIHLEQAQKFEASYRQLQNNRFRYYDKIKPPIKEGEMIGRRKVREWDPATGLKRTWHETLDGNNTVRIVRPQTDDGIKTHYLFDSEGNFIGVR